MPTVSMFYGIVIRMFWDDHAPPHFHAEYGEYEIVVEIEMLRVLKGKMPVRARALVLEWATLHQKELFEDWELCRQEKMPKKIKPLV